MAENCAFLANGLENNPRKTALYRDFGKPEVGENGDGEMERKCLKNIK